MKKKILITGSNGLLGQKIIYGLLGDPLCLISDELRKKINNEVEIIATARGKNRLSRKDGYIYESLDITNKSEVENVFAKYNPNIIINTAAMTNVDACETKREECRQTNVIAVQNIVEAIQNPKSKIQNCHFIHLSTDFVFDGTKGGPYNENDKPNPLHYYALSKLEGEKIVMASKIRWAIIRTIIIYGVVDDMSRSNIVLWTKNSLEKGQKINVVNDQFRSPTLAEDLSQGCILAAMKSAEGIYHISGKDILNIIDMVYTIADFWKLDKSFINPVSSEELHQPAKRPLYTGFILDKARKELGYNPRSFIEGLKIVDGQLKKYIVSS
ncbi:MAG: SDR family oxidoreductase [Bacteroidota bacterium]